MNVTRAAEASASAAKAHHDHGGALHELGDWFKDAAGEAVAFGAGLAGLQIGQSILENLSRAIVDFPEQIERLGITFSTFLGGGEIGAGVVRQIQGLAGALPFQFGGLADVAKTLAALGTPAGDIAPRVRDIAAAVASLSGTDADLQRVAMTLGRISETGVVDARVMRSLVAESIPAWQILEVGLGKTKAQLDAMLKSGEITSEVFNEAFHTWASTTAGYALAKQTDTVSGSLTVLSNNLQEASSIALEPFTERLDKAAAASAKLAQTGVFQAGARGVGAALGAVLNAVVPNLPDPTATQAANDRLNALAHTTRDDAAATTAASDAMAEFRAQFGQVPVAIDAARARLEGWDDSLARTTAALGAVAAAEDDLDHRLAGLSAQFGREDNRTLEREAADERAMQRADHKADIQRAYAEQVAATTEAERKAEEAARKAAEAANALGHADLSVLRDDTAALSAQLAKVTQELSDLSHPHLIGQGAADERVFNLEERLKAAQLRLDQAQLAGVHGAGLAALQAREQQLQRQIDIARLQEDLRFDRPLRQIALAAAGPITEQSPTAVLAAIAAARSEYDLLTPELDKAKESVIGFRTALDQARVGKAQGFANGGSFVVGGQGGTDRSYVGFWATPGERVSVGSSAGAAGGVVVNVAAGAIQVSGAASAAQASDIEAIMSETFRGLDTSMEAYFRNQNVRKPTLAGAS